MFIRVRSVLGEDVFVNADRIVTIHPAYRFRDGRREDMVGATLRMDADYNVQCHETPAAVMDLIDRAREAY